MGLDMMLYKQKKIRNEEEIAYWRKANMVHKYLCDNGICITEDVEYIIPFNVLRNLLDICKEIKEKAVMVDGMVYVGTKYENGESIRMMREGKVIENKEEIADMLPTQEGFFFGGYDYDEFYMAYIEETIQKLENILKDLDEEEDSEYEYEIKYYASW